jgi:hypothetical protein
MPRTIVPTSAPGTVDNWSFAGAATSWQAVSYGSDDSSFIYTSSVGVTSDFYCGSGWVPTGGRIMAATVHYRIRQTAPVASQVQLIITQSAVQHAVGAPVVLSGTSWTVGEFRVREDWVSGARFTLTEVGDLGAGISVVAPPASGRIEISQLWIEVEYIDSPFKYDPYDGLLPDAVVGPLAWLTVGTAPVAIDPSNYFVITDSLVSTSRHYLMPSPTIVDQYDPDYISEFELRFSITDLSATTDSYLANLISIMDSSACVIVGVAKIGGNYFLTYTDTHIVSFPPTYTLTAPFLYEGQDTHIRVVTDRDNSSGPGGRTQVFVNYSSIPLLDILTDNLSEQAVASPFTEFGTYNGCQSVYSIDYISWKHYKKRGNTFRSWSNWNFGDNEISATSADSEIVRKVLITPPGVTAGQSNNACVLDVADPTMLCEIFQLEKLLEAAPSTYKIDVDYRMDIAAVEGELVVQRTSDLWYWDEVGSVWQSAFQSVTLTNQLSRTRLAAMTGINVVSLEADAILVTIRRKTSTPPPYNIFIYRVHLSKE